MHGLFLDPAAETSLDDVYERFIGAPISLRETAYVSKRQVMDFELASELRVLASEYNRLTESSWLTRDYTLVGLRQALREVVACFPVYRTYVTATARAAAGPARHRVGGGARAPAQRARGQDGVRLPPGGLDDRSRSRPEPVQPARGAPPGDEVSAVHRPGRGQGVEDTAFYRYNRLVSLNEVGGEPTRFGTTVSAFHKITQDARRRWPHTMLATATHDTKRGEDARVRIDVLSEMPTEWGRRVRRWATLNQRRKAVVNDEPAPTANDEYLFYQALIGSWPPSSTTRRNSIRKRSRRSASGSRPT